MSAGARRRRAAGRCGWWGGHAVAVLVDRRDEDLFPRDAEIDRPVECPIGGNHASSTEKLEIFKQLVPTSSRMAAIWNPTLPGLAPYRTPFQTASTTLGMAVYSLEYSRAEELDRALAAVLKDRPDAIFFWGDPLAAARRQALCEFALQNRLPTLGPGRYFTEVGCLVSYAPSRLEQFRRAPLYVDKILKGARPADLPLEQPTKFELIINGKTAKALGLAIPPSLLLRADQVIE